MLSFSFFTEQISECLRKMPAPHYAFWDLDGTIISGDVTDGCQKPKYTGLMDRVIAKGLHPKYRDSSQIEQFWADMRLHVPHAQAVARSFMDLDEATEAALRSFVRMELPSYLPYVFNMSLDLMHFMLEQKVVPVIISASPHYFVEELDVILPVEKKNLFGMKPWAKGIEATQAEGKLAIVKRILAQGGSGVFAAGNSWASDGPMIRAISEGSGVGVMLDDKGQDRGGSVLVTHWTDIGTFSHRV
jgi:phosphoserine phosphatase